MIGTNHKTPTFVGSFFSRNPLFNPVYYSLLDSENFELPYLISIENIQREFASYKIELSNKSNSLSVKNNQKINYTLSYLNDSIIPSEIFGELNKTNFKWKLLKSFSSEPFSIPSDIICNYYDKSGNITNDSYSIEMDIASFSILTSKPELKIFELPATIAKFLYDTDIGVTLKDECWK
ncbi:MAG: hypothetical protein HC845_05610 [Akkermansiaceae bacterium]|nr:hypothetical protein [Akkermansiaceae bacterium]